MAWFVLFWPPTAMTALLEHTSYTNCTHNLFSHPLIDCCCPRNIPWLSWRQCCCLSQKFTYVQVHLHTGSPTYRFTYVQVHLRTGSPAYRFTYVQVHLRTAVAACHKPSVLGPPPLPQLQFQAPFSFRPPSVLGPPPLPQLQFQAPLPHHNFSFRPPSSFLKQGEQNSARKKKSRSKLLIA